MPHFRSIKFQHWIVGMVGALVIVLTAVFLLTMVGQFRTAAQASAGDRFTSVSLHVSDLLRQQLQVPAQRAMAMAQAGPAAMLAQGRPVVERIFPILRASLDQSPGIYSEYLGLPDDEFIQAIGVRGDADIAQALKAPVNTHVALRHIRVGPDGQRREQWRFLDKTGAEIGQRQAASSYRPTTRPWYAGAQQSSGAFLTDPYVFSSTQTSGVTLAARFPGGEAVYGIDIDLRSLPAFLERLPLSPNAFLAILDDQQRVLAASAKGDALGALPAASLAPLADSQDPRQADLLRVLSSLPQGQASVRNLGGKPHLLANQSLDVGQGARFQIVSWAPTTDFTAPVDRARRDVLAVSAVVLLVLVPLALLGTRGVTSALAAMARDSERLRHLDFSAEPHTVHSFLYEIDALGDAQAVMHRSVKERAAALEVAQAKLAQLVETGIQLGRQQNREELLRQALFGARDIAHCQAATIFLKTERNTLAFAIRTSDDPLPSQELPLYDVQGQPIHRFVATHVVLSGETVVIDDIYQETRFDVSGTKKFSDETGMRVVSTLNVPMKPQDGKVIGLIQLMNALDPKTGEVVPFDPEIVSFIEALAAQAAVAIENQNLIDAQKALMDSMIQIIAGAIDTKSPYTGGHCERVPELAIMLAEQACEVKKGPLAEFEFQTEEEWREFRIGAWLHDCGKVTTPEYVVDKATKLETIFNRIHEIRTRFEVLLRDAQIERLQAIHEHNENRTAADARYEARKAQLMDDFAFIAECNLGGEFMAPDRIERVRRIAEQTWLRHFDDRLGLSHEELKRYENLAPDTLPVVERLLADKPHHLFQRPPNKALDPKHGFKLKVPEYLYNHGEVYNLSIGRGTLTEEERFKINEHIIQTIVMLENMPLPPNLRRVPEYAGTHHETLIGTGYPRKLEAKDLSVPSRIMAIADIFEALTASDRPYKKAKTLSESIKILWMFKKDQHIDPDLFDLFLRSGVYKSYAEKYLHPDQIDEVNIAEYLSPTDGTTHS
jgi:HD-GYP domain-containing protein (c-di-GMP phosphodiesterase class II)